MQWGIAKRTQINLSWSDTITASLVPVLPKHEKKKWQNGVCRKPKPTQYSAPATHTSWFTSTKTIRKQHWLRQPTVNLLRLRMLNGSRRRTHGSESFQRSWTHRTELFPTSSESPQKPQTSNGGAAVFVCEQDERIVKKHQNSSKNQL